VPSLVRRAVQAGSLDETVCPETCEVEKACRGPPGAGDGAPRSARARKLVLGLPSALQAGRRGALWRLRPARFGSAASGASFDGPIWTGDGFASGA